MSETLQFWITPASLLIIFIVSAAIYRLFPERPSLDEERVLRHLMRHYPEMKVSWVLVSNSGDTALAGFENDTRLGIARTMGKRIAVRVLDPSELAVAERTRQVRLTSTDYTLPSVSLTIVDDSKRTELVSWIQAQGATNA